MSKKIKILIVAFVFLVVLLLALVYFFSNKSISLQECIKRGGSINNMDNKCYLGDKVISR
jgi:hypothetical protein